MIGGGAIGGGIGGDRGLKLTLVDTLRYAWADPELRQRILFVLMIFTIYAVGVNVPVPVPGISPSAMELILQQNDFFVLLNMIGGGAFGKVSIFALGLGPYISSSIVMQVLQASIPAWKQEMKEGGQYARHQQNRRTRTLMLIICFFQSIVLLSTLNRLPAIDLTWWSIIQIAIFWTAGAMFLLWLGEQVSEKGIGNGVSLIIFAGIVIALPSVIGLLTQALQQGTVQYYQAGLIALMFLATTLFIVYFTVAQRRIPIQHMRRQFGTKAMGGKTSYLPISVNMAGVIPVIFAIALLYLPMSMADAFDPDSAPHQILMRMGQLFQPDFTRLEGYIGVLVYSGLIFVFTYLWNTLQFNVDDISDNLKQGGSFIPGIRPGKQTRNFLDGVISRVTFVGAVFLAIVALTQYLFPVIAPLPNLGLIGGTSLLIMVSVALETMRQIEANLLVKQYE